jgi:hypothetical protein
MKELTPEDLWFRLATFNNEKVGIILNNCGHITLYGLSTVDAENLHAYIQHNDGADRVVSKNIDTMLDFFITAVCKEKTTMSFSIDDPAMHRVYKAIKCNEEILYVVN